MHRQQTLAPKKHLATIAVVGLFLIVFAFLSLSLYGQVFDSTTDSVTQGLSSDLKNTRSDALNLFSRISSAEFGHLLALTLAMGGFILTVLSIIAANDQEFFQSVVLHVVIRIEWIGFALTIRTLLLITFIIGLSLLFVAFLLLLLQYEPPIWYWVTALYWNIFAFIVITVWLVLVILIVRSGPPPPPSIGNPHNRPLPTD